MLAICLICTDPYTSDSVVKAVACGHVFHESCLGKWTEKSKTCPQCRRHANSILKIYLNFSNDYQQTVNCECSSFVKEKQFELETKLLEVRQLTKESSMLKDEVTALSERLCGVQAELKEEKNKTKILAKEVIQITEMKEELRRAKLEISSLLKQVDQYRNVDTILHGCSTDVERLLSNCHDTQQLATWCSVFKRELERKKGEYQDISSKLSRQRQQFDLLKKDLQTCLSEKNQLALELKECTSGNPSPSIVSKLSAASPATCRPTSSYNNFTDKMNIAEDQSSAKSSDVRRPSTDVPALAPKWSKLNIMKKTALKTGRVEKPSKSLGGHSYNVARRAENRPLQLSHSNIFNSSNIKRLDKLNCSKPRLPNLPDFSL